MTKSELTKLVKNNIGTIEDFLIDPTCLIFQDEGINTIVKAFQKAAIIYLVSVIREELENTKNVDNLTEIESAILTIETKEKEVVLVKVLKDFVTEKLKENAKM